MGTSVVQVGRDANTDKWVKLSPFLSSQVPLQHCQSP